LEIPRDDFMNKVLNFIGNIKEKKD
jgi:hypothetical protein